MPIFRSRPARSLIPFVSRYKAISFKIQPKVLRVGSDDKVVKQLAKCKEFYEKYFVNIRPVVEEKEG